MVDRDPKELVNKLKNLHMRRKIALATLALFILGITLLTWTCFSGVFTPAITQVMLSDYSLNMSTGDIEDLFATVLYSNNTENKEVFWVSSNKAVVQVNEDGQVTALSAGVATITAQAANRKSQLWKIMSISIFGQKMIMFHKLPFMQKLLLARCTPHLLIETIYIVFIQRLVPGPFMPH